MTLAEFLLARIAEDEAVAQAATQSVKWWDWAGSERHKMASVRAHEDPYIARGVTNGDATHIARHDPRRVLAECESKRRIVEDANYMLSYAGEGDNELPQLNAPRLLRLLALPYAAHPDYREEWTP